MFASGVLDDKVVAYDEPGGDVVVVPEHVHVVDQRVGAPGRRDAHGTPLEAPVVVDVRHVQLRRPVAHVRAVVHDGVDGARVADV